MHYSIITTQPKAYNSFLETSLIARAISQEIIKIKIFNLYDFAFDKRRSIDDTPYGGGAGMILRVDVIDQALIKIKNPSRKRQKPKTILLTPQGKRLDQKTAKKLAKEQELILISGRFEGYDERIRNLAHEEISIGDFVLTSGDLPAMVLIDVISRNIPGFIQKPESIQEETFSQLNLGRQIKKCLEYPQYTKPLEYKGEKVPEILLSGNHQQIANWRKKKAIEKSLKKS